jgi:hypothetical protein
MWEHVSIVDGDACNPVAVKLPDCKIEDINSQFEELAN